MQFRYSLLMAAGVACICEAAPAAGHLIHAEAIVADARGHIAPDLTAADFALEPGKGSKIASCEYVDTRQRRTMVFIVDDLGLTPDAIGSVRQGLEKFVQTLLPGDRMAILRTGSGEGHLQQLSGDREYLARSLARVYYNPRRGFYHSGAARAGAFATAGIGTLRHAIVGLSRLPGRKSVMLFTSEVNDLPVNDLEALANDARYSGVSVYAMDPSAPLAKPVEPGQVASKAQPLAFTSLALGHLVGQNLDGLAQRTAGELLGGGADVAGVMGRALGGPDGYYRIAYEPSKSWTVAPELKVVRPGCQLLASRRVTEDVVDLLGMPRQREDVLPRAMTDAFDTGEIRTRITPLFYYTGKENRAIVVVQFDAHDISLRERLDGTYRGGATLLVASFGATSQSLGAREQHYEFYWTPAQYQNVLRTGIATAIEIPLNGPMLQIRALVSDEDSGRLGSANAWIEAPDVSDGRLALSGVDLAEGGGASAPGQAKTKQAASPHTGQVFHTGRPIEYQCEVYNARLDAEKTARMELQMVLYREGRLVMANRPVELSLRASDARRAVGVTGTITLPEHLEPGRYEMQFAVTDKVAADETPRVASQFTDVQLEK